MLNWCRISAELLRNFGKMSEDISENCPDRSSTDGAKPGLGFDRVEHGFQIFALFQALWPTGNGIELGPSTFARKLLDRVERMFCGVPEDGKHSPLAGEIHRIITPFSRRDAPTVFIQKNSEFVAVERNLTRFAIGLVQGLMRTHE